MDLLPFFHTLADAAASAILPHFRQPSTRVENKQENRFDPVTAADQAAERAMRQLIQQKFPDHGILGEEFGNENLSSNHVWVLDPIDGTRAFISGLPTWGTLIGQKVSGQAAMGMMSQAFTKERFFGDGRQAFHEDRNGKTLLKTRSCAHLSGATLFTTSPRFFSEEAYLRYEAVENQVKLSSFGVDCYAYCMVAMGQVDLVVEEGLKPYDVAALIPIVEGAGGVITTWTGENAVDGGSIVAAGDPALHETVLGILNG